MLRFFVLFAVFHISYGNRVVVVGPAAGNAWFRRNTSLMKLSRSTCLSSEFDLLDDSAAWIQQLGPAAPSAFFGVNGQSHYAAICSFEPAFVRRTRTAITGDHRADHVAICDSLETRFSLGAGFCGAHVRYFACRLHFVEL